MFKLIWTTVLSVVQIQKYEGTVAYRKLIGRNGFLVTAEQIKMTRLEKVASDDNEGEF